MNYHKVDRPVYLPIRSRNQMLPTAQIQQYRWNKKKLHSNLAQFINASLLPLHDYLQQQKSPFPRVSQLSCILDVYLQEEILKIKKKKVVGAQTYFQQVTSSHQIPLHLEAKRQAEKTELEMRPHGSPFPKAQRWWSLPTLSQPLSASLTHALSLQNTSSPSSYLSLLIWITTILTFQSGGKILPM